MTVLNFDYLRADALAYVSLLKPVLSDCIRDHLSSNRIDVHRIQGGIDQHQPDCIRGFPLPRENVV